MPTRSDPVLAELIRWPGPMIPASISPAISAATASGERGITTYCMSRPCFLNKPRSRATHMGVMLSLVTLDAKLVRVCACAQSVKSKTAMASTTMHWPWRLKIPQENIVKKLVWVLLAHRLHPLKKLLLESVIIVFDIPG